MTLPGNAPGWARTAAEAALERPGLQVMRLLIPAFPAAARATPVSKRKTLGWVVSFERMPSETAGTRKARSVSSRIWKYADEGLGRDLFLEVGLHVGGQRGGTMIGIADHQGQGAPFAGLGDAPGIPILRPDEREHRNLQRPPGRFPGTPRPRSRKLFAGGWTTRLICAGTPRRQILPLRGGKCYCFHHARDEKEVPGDATHAAREPGLATDSAECNSAATFPTRAGVGRERPPRGSATTSARTCRPETGR
jgi:hypothetical protein